MIVNSSNMRAIATADDLEQAIRDDDESSSSSSSEAEEKDEEGWLRWRSAAYKCLYSAVFEVLTAKKSNLFKCTFAIVFFILCVLFYKWDEGWSLIDTCYFMVFTLTTVGKYRSK
jgi:hypothetical protein